MPFRVGQYFDMKTIRNKNNSSHKHILENGGIILLETISEIIGNSVVISNASISDNNILGMLPEEKSNHHSCPSVNSVIQ